MADPPATASMRYPEDLVTPYAAFPLLLHTHLRPYGLAWYIAMLQGAKMQGPLGSSLAGAANGTRLNMKFLR